MRSQKAATSAPGAGSCRNSYRPVTARSSAAYRSAAIAICAACSFRLPGSCWSRSGQSIGTGTGSNRGSRPQRSGYTQRASDPARQQARPHRLGGSSQGARLRVRQDQCRVPTRLILAPCSGPSRHGLATLAREARQAQRPTLTVLALGAPPNPQVGTKERPPGTNKGTAQPWEAIDDMINTLNPPSSARG